MNDYLAKHDRPLCRHNPPRSKTGALGTIDTCTCGATQYVLRQKGNDGSGKPGKRWDRWR